MGLSILDVAIFAALLLCSAFFSCSESALTAVNRLRIKALADEGSTSAKRVASLLENPSRVISTLLIGNNVVNIGLSMFAALVFTQAIVAAFSVSEALAATVAGVASLIFLLVLGEVIPKTIGINMPLRMALVLAWPISAVQVILMPLTLLTGAIQRLVLKLLRHDADSATAVTHSDIEAMARIAEDQEVIQASSARAIVNLVSLHHTRIREAMTPRVDVLSIGHQASYADVIELLKSHRFSRIPVHLHSIDDIIGILNFRDLIGLSDEEKKDFNVERYMRTPLFVPELKRVNELILEMRAKKAHIAIVVDEYGGTAGVVTLEDLLEEVVGQIEDEFDTEGPRIRAVGRSSVIADASCSMSELGDALGVSLEADDGVDTLGGMFMQEFGKIPAEGDSVSFKNLSMVVNRMAGRRITRVFVSRLQDAKQRTVK